MMRFEGEQWRLFVRSDDLLKEAVSQMVFSSADLRHDQMIWIT
jgi:hypothetical protein